MKCRASKRAGACLCVQVKSRPSVSRECHAISAAKVGAGQAGPPALPNCKERRQGAPPPPSLGQVGLHMCSSAGRGRRPATSCVVRRRRSRRCCRYCTPQPLLLLRAAAGRELLLLLREWISPLRTCGSTRAPSPRSGSGLRGRQFESNNR